MTKNQLFTKKDVKLELKILFTSSTKKIERFISIKSCDLFFLYPIRAPDTSVLLGVDFLNIVELHEDANGEFQIGNHNLEIIELKNNQTAK